jgi:hypothetical protein
MTVFETHVSNVSPIEIQEHPMNENLTLSSFSNSIPPGTR